jgi:SEC-C motif
MANMKTGRNDPCPCGSGKKYKQCCLLKDQALPENDFLWRRVRRAIEGSPMQMLEFSTSHFGPDALLEAWDEFTFWRDIPFTMDTPHIAVFMPWFFFDWAPDPLDTEVKKSAQDGRTLGRAYLHKKGKNLDPLRVRYLEQCCANPFSFYDVLAVRLGDGFLLRDIFTEAELYVTEHSGSNDAKEGDIMFAKLVSIDEVTLIEACGPIRIPPIEKSAILDLRKKMKSTKLPMTTDLLRDYDFEMLEIYHDIHDRLLNPMMPTLQNTDGDPMLLHKLIYTLECSTREAFDALKRLDLPEDDKALLQQATFDADGQLRKVDIVWARPDGKADIPDQSTILAHISIDGKNLTAQVNSANRAEKFKGAIDALLPGKARYKTSVIESPEAMLDRADKENDLGKRKQNQSETEDLRNSPEVQAHINNFYRDHYHDWPNHPLPALKGKTPLQAIKTKNGKEMVAALIMEFEQRGQLQDPPLDPAIITELRERLKIT